MLFDYKDQLKTGECCLHMWSSFPGMSGARATVFFCVFSPHHRNRACPAFSIAFQGVVGRMYWCCRNSVLAVPVLLLLYTVMAPRALLKLRLCFTWHCTHDVKGCCCPTDTMYILVVRGQENEVTCSGPCNDQWQSWKQFCALLSGPKLQQIRIYRLCTLLFRWERWTSEPHGHSTVQPQHGKCSILGHLLPQRCIASCVLPVIWAGRGHGCFFGRHRNALAS